MECSRAREEQWKRSEVTQNVKRTLAFCIPGGGAKLAANYVAVPFETASEGSLLVGLMNPRSQLSEE